MSEILFQSLINVDLWNEAYWTATAFLYDPRSADPPYLGLVFENTEAGRKIFGELRDRIGAVDEFEELYISIVEGEILGEDPGYTVHISSDPLRTESRLRSEGKDFTFDEAIIVSRFHRMIPAPGSPHLSKFKSEVRVHGRYSLIPVSSEVQPQFDCAIEKREVHFRQASDITRTDRDAVVLPVNYFDSESIN